MRGSRENIKTVSESKKEAEFITNTASLILFFIALFLVILIMRYAREVKSGFIVITFLAMKNKGLSCTMLHWSIVTHA